MTWRELEGWLTQYESRHTRRAYRSDLELAREALAVPVHLADVADVGRWLEDLSNGRRTRALAALRSYLRFGRDAGWWEQAPALALKTRRRERLPPRVPTEAQVGHLFECEAVPRNRRLLALLYFGALRVAEAVAVRVEDLEGSVLRFTGKGGHRRAVRLPTSVADTLEEAQDYIVSALRDPGRPLSTRRARSVVYAAAGRVGLEISPHVLRHAHATHALRAGCKVHVVRQTLGHKDIQTTAGYLHAEPTETSSSFLPLQGFSRAIASAPSK